MRLFKKVKDYNNTDDVPLLFVDNVDNQTFCLCSEGQVQLLPVKSMFYEFLSIHLSLVVSSVPLS